jgi:hypothetical protein
MHTIKLKNTEQYIIKLKNNIFEIKINTNIVKYVIKTDKI